MESMTPPASSAISRAVQLRDVSFSYAGSEFTALSSVSCSFPKGQVTALVGANGSGKSTLLRIIAGQLIPSDGSLYIGGELVDDDNVDRLISSNIGMVFQNPDAQFVASTVREDIAFGLENDRVPADRMDEAIRAAAAATGVNDLLSREPDALSGGQKQRVALAGVLVRRPSILLLDEATSMLDPLARRGVFELLERIERDFESLTVIQVTHDWREAVRADHLIALDRGWVVFEGEPGPVFADYDRALKLGLEPSFEAELGHTLEREGLEAGSFNTPEGLARCLGLR